MLLFCGGVGIRVRVRVMVWVEREWRFEGVIVVEV